MYAKKPHLVSDKEKFRKFVGNIKIQKIVSAMKIL